MINDVITNSYGYTTYVPPLDLTSIASTNFVNGELHAVSNDGGSIYCYILANYGPFYANTMVVHHAASGVVGAIMTLGVDYVFAFPFIGATRSTGFSVYGAVQFINPLFSGQVTLQYQTVGGVWVTSPTLNASILNSPIVVKDPQILAWEQVANYTSAFPNTTTPWDRVDSTTIDAVSAAIISLRNGIKSSALSLDWSLEIGHMTNFANPHNDTSTTVGLQNVANLPAATQQQAGDVNNNTTYISAAELTTTYSTSLYQATTTVVGTAELNTGTIAGDDVDTQKALTAAGLVKLLGSNPNAFGGVVNRVQGMAVIAPFPVPASFSWQGNTYTSLTGLMTAVCAYCGVTTLEYSTITGTVWFPPYVAVPDLTLH